MFNNTSIYSESWCRAVFANRNQAYGAYDLRKAHERNTFMGLLLTTTLAAGISIYVNYKNHGAPIPPEISAVALDHNDTTEVMLANIEEPKPEPAAATEVVPPPPAPPEPVIEEPNTAPADNANIRIVKDIKPEEKIPVTNIATSSGPVNPNPTPPTIPTTTTGTGTGGTVGGKGTAGDPPPMKVAEVMPEFPGGVKALMSYIGNNTTYPEPAKEIGKEGTVYVTFIVERNGEVSNVHVEKSIFKPIDNEAIRVVKSMPTWKPGMQNGNAVRVQFTVPIKFVLAS